MFKNNFITFSKKGVTLVSLVITIVILAIIVGVIVNTTLGDEGVVTEAEKTLREQERKMLIETIAKEIQTTKLKKEMSGENSFTVQEDIRPILVEYGKYEDLKLKLTTKEGIEIYLYEIMQISMLEYAQIQYNDNKLTITSELLNNGYEIEYTLNNGSAWDEYEEVVNITNGEGIYARIVTKDGKVISNTIKVKEGTMQSDDIVAPIVKIEPSSGKGRTINVTIDIIEYGQLDESNLYQYYLSTSQFVQENGEWTNYIPGETFTLKPENEGIYYLHIRGVSDKVGNITIDKVVGPYELIKNEGTAAVAPTVTLSVNENTTLSKEQTTVIQIESNNEVMYNYGWSNSSTQAPEQWKASMSKAQTVTIDQGQGNYYLWIKDLQDINGNKADTIIVNGTEVNLISGVFAVDNNKLVSIAVEMRKSKFIVEEKISKSDIIVTATYESGKTQQVTGYTYSPTGALTTSNKNVMISYTENGVTKTATKGITVAYPTDGRYYAAKGVNSPLLAEGMTAVYWNGTTEVTSANPGTDSNFDYNSWYDYKAQTGATTSGGTSKWANAKTADGSYWVWIPRYAYAITSGYHGEGLTYVNGITSEAGTIEVEFLKGKTNISTTGRTQYAEAAGANNWNVHPAFYYDGTSTTGTQLAGIWVAKYEMSMETNGVVTETSSSSVGNVSVVDNTSVKAVSKPGVKAWTYISESNMFINSLNYDTTSLSNAKLDSHLMKNSEWGAVTYLTHSKYGRNSVEIIANTFDGYYTAGGNGATPHSNVLQSSTGNCYGVFDLSGGCWEIMAAYIGENNKENYQENIFASENRYIDIYDYPDSESDYGERNDVRIYGDGLWEVSNSANLTTSGARTAWFKDFVEFPNYNFIQRGAAISDMAIQGIFTTWVFHTEMQKYHSFRVVLWGETTN